MNDDATPVILLIIAVFGVSMIMGSVISEPGNVKKGRNDGIVFCSEKPDECKIEYTYLKLKENQK